MRVYKPPVFNLTCWAWHDVLPADLVDWNGFRPARAADVEAACQLYIPRNGMGRWNHAIADDAVKTLTQSGLQELRLPRGTALRTAWGVGPTTTWANASLVEVPARSGRLYAVCLVDNKHTGFPNEYVVAYLAQLRNVGQAGPIAAGTAMSADAIASQGALTIAAGGGASLELTTPEGLWIYLVPGLPPQYAILGTWASSPRVGAAMLADVTAGTPRSSFGVGSALSMKAGGIGGESELGLGAAMERPEPPANFLIDLPVGTAIAATSSTLQGTSVGGATCETAYECQLGELVRFTSPGVSSPRWFKFIITTAGVYKATCRSTQGNNTTVSWMHGVCPTPGSWASQGVGSTAVCNASNLNPGIFFVKFNGPASSSSYTIQFGAGAC